MKTLILSSILLAAAVSAATLQAVRLSAPLNLDGQLREAAWAAAPAYDAFQTTRGGAPAERTTVKFLFDDHAVYVGIRCAEAHPSEMKRLVTPRDGNIYSQDCVEVMLDPGKSMERYFHFLVSANGALADQYCEQGGFLEDPSWNGAWQARTFVGPDFWSCEMKIPFYNFAGQGGLGGKWGVNVCRAKYSNPREDMSIAGGKYHNVAFFQELDGIQADFTPYAVTLKAPECALRTADGGKLFAVPATALENHGARERAFALDSWLVAPASGEILIGPATELRLKPGERRTVALPEVQVRSQGAYQLFVRAVDASTGRVAACRDATAKLVFSPVAIRLDTPWYRYTIFETQKIESIVMDVDVALAAAERKGRRLRVAVLGGDRPVHEQVLADVQNTQRVTIPNRLLPYGTFSLTAELLDAAGKPVPLTQCRVPLRKLPYRKGETWLTRDASLTVEGRPFFLQTQWNGPNPDFSVSFAMDPARILPGQRWLSGAVCWFPEKNDPGLIRALQSGHVDDKYLELFRRQARKIKDHPLLVGHYLVDEPIARSLHPDSLRQVYEAIRDEDPYHPVVISDSSQNLYIRACDIQVHHPYPLVLDTVPFNDCRTILTSMVAGQRMLENEYHKVCFIFMDCGFNKYDYGLGGREGRIATFREFVDHNLMAFAVGMKGLMPFNVCADPYPEFTIGYPAIVKLAAWLGAYTVAPDAGRATPSSPHLHAIWKSWDGNQVLIASNVSMQAGRFTIRLENLPAEVRELHVVGENRTVPVVGGAVADDFRPCGGHAYSVKRPPASVPDFAATEARIEEAWRAKQKPGNLLFTRFLIRSRVKVTASVSQSSTYSHSTQDSMLWHLCDGYFPEKIGGYGFFYWQANADRLPAWLLFELQEPQTIGRIKVYTIQNSLKSMTCEVLTEAGWRAVGEVTDNARPEVEFVFPPVRTARFRLTARQAVGKAVFLSEVEAYAK